MQGNRMCNHPRIKWFSFPIWVTSGSIWVDLYRVKEVQEQHFESHDSEHQQPQVIDRIVLELCLFLRAPFAAGLQVKEFI